MSKPFLLSKLGIFLVENREFTKAIEPQAMQQGEALEYVATFEVFPEFTEALDYGFSVSRPVVDVADTGTGMSEQVLANVFDTRAGLNNPLQEVEAKGFSLLGEWETNDLVMFRAIFASRDDESWSPIDFDSLPEADLDVPVIYENEQTSAELQAVFSGDKWNGVAGIYYLDANAFNAFDVILGLTGGVIGLPGLNSFTLGDVDTKTWSVYGDFTYDFSEQWALSLGGRWTEDKRSSTVLRQTMIGGTSEFFGGNAIPIAVTSDFNGSETFDKFTPRISLQWRPNGDNNLYATYSEGFKGGSFDPRGLTTAAPDLDGDGVVSDEEIFEFMKFDPEEVKSLEFGWKTTLFGGRMTSNLAVFLGDYTDVQVPGSIGLDTDGDGINDQFVGITTNAGEADIDGIEWEGQAILADNLGASGADLSLAWAIGYIDAEYKEFIDATGQKVADQRVFQNTPLNGGHREDVPCAGISGFVCGPPCPFSQHGCCFPDRCL